MTGRISLIVLRRLRLNLINLRFTCVGLLTVILIALSAQVMGRDLHRRLEYVQTRQAEWQDELRSAPTYSVTYGQMVFWPRTFSVVSEGVAERIGVVAVAGGAFNKLSISGLARSNTHLVLLPVDLAHIIGLLLSLLALLLTFDVVAGEREQGTLRLTLAQGISRRALMFGEYLGTVLSVAVPLLLSFLVWIGVVRFIQGIQFQSEEWLKLALAIILSLLYVSIFALVGLLLSSTIRESVTVLMAVLLLWVGTTALWPNAAAWMATRLEPVQPSATFSLSERPLFERLVLQAKLNASLQALSPTGLFYSTLSRLADTDLNAYIRFVNASRQYQHDVENWHRQKIGHDVKRAYHGWGEVSVDDFPPPPPITQSLSESLVSCLPAVGVIVTLNLLLSLFAILALNRYDVC